MNYIDGAIGQAVAGDVEHYDNYLWGYVGNPYTGFYIVNKSDTSLKLKADASANTTTMASDGTPFIAEAVDAGAEGSFTDPFVFKIKDGSGKCYLNYQNETFKFWDDKDAGSALWAQTAPTITDYGRICYSHVVPEYGKVYRIAADFAGTPYWLTGSSTLVAGTEGTLDNTQPLWYLTGDPTTGATFKKVDDGSVLTGNSQTVFVVRNTVYALYGVSLTYSNTTNLAACATDLNLSGYFSNNVTHNNYKGTGNKYYSSDFVFVVDDTKRVYTVSTELIRGGVTYNSTNYGNGALVVMDVTDVANISNFMTSVPGYTSVANVDETNHTITVTYTIHNETIYSESGNAHVSPVKGHVYKIAVDFDGTPYWFSGSNTFTAGNATDWSTQGSYFIDGTSSSLQIISKADHSVKLTAQKTASGSAYTTFTTTETFSKTGIGLQYTDESKYIGVDNNNNQLSVGYFSDPKNNTDNRYSTDFVFIDDPSEEVWYITTTGVPTGKTGGVVYENQNVSDYLVVPANTDVSTLDYVAVEGTADATVTIDRDNWAITVAYSELNKFPVHILNQTGVEAVISIKSQTADATVLGEYQTVADGGYYYYSGTKQGQADKILETTDFQYTAIAGFAPQIHLATNSQITFYYVARPDQEFKESTEGANRRYVYQFLAEKEAYALCYDATNSTLTSSSTHEGYPVTGEEFALYPVDGEEGIYYLYGTKAGKYLKWVNHDTKSTKLTSSMVTYSDTKDSDNEKWKLASYTNHTFDEVDAQGFPTWVIVPYDLKDNDPTTALDASRSLACDNSGKVMWWKAGSENHDSHWLSYMTDIQNQYTLTVVPPTSTTPTIKVNGVTHANGDVFWTSEGSNEIVDAEFVTNYHRIIEVDNANYTITVTYELVTPAGELKTSTDDVHYIYQFVAEGLDGYEDSWGLSCDDANGTIKVTDPILGSPTPEEQFILYSGGEKSVYKLSGHHQDKFFRYANLDNHYLNTVYHDAQTVFLTDNSADTDDYKWLIKAYNVNHWTFVPYALRNVSDVSTAGTSTPISARYSGLQSTQDKTLTWGVASESNHESHWLAYLYKTEYKYQVIVENASDVVNPKVNVDGMDYGNGEYVWTDETSITTGQEVSGFLTTVDKDEDARTITMRIVDPNTKTKVTYNYKYKGNTVYTSAATDMVYGLPYEVIDQPYGVTLHLPEGNVPAGAVTKDVNIDYIFDFTTNASDNDKTWYMINVNSGATNFLWSSADYTAAITSDAQPTGDDGEYYMWTFIGNPWEGFKLLNTRKDCYLYQTSGATGATTPYSASASIYTVDESLVPGSWTGIVLTLMNKTNSKYISTDGATFAVNSENNANSAIKLTYIDVIERSVIEEYLSHTGCGYPKADATCRTKLETFLNVTHPNQKYFPRKGIIESSDPADYDPDKPTLLDNFLGEHDNDNIQFPEDGKAYKIRNHMEGYTDVYVKYNYGGKLGMTENVDEATTFVFVRSAKNTADERFYYSAIIHDTDHADKTKYFLYAGPSEGISSRAGYTEGYADYTPMWMNKGAYQNEDKTPSADTWSRDLHGQMCIGGQYSPTDTGKKAYLTRTSANSWGTATVGYQQTYKEGSSSMWFFDEVTDYTANLVTLKSSGGKIYTSLYLPYAAKIPTGAKAYKAILDNEEYWTIDLAELTDVIPAHTACVLMMDGSDNTDVTLVPAEIQYDNDGNPTDNHFGGVFEETPVSSVLSDGYTCYVLSKTDAKGVGFYRYTSDKTLQPYKAYYLSNYGNESGANSFRMMLDGEDVTGMFTGQIVRRASDRVFDLQGREVKEPVKGNIYIINGKKQLF